ncbi:MAG: hypothetical protein K6E18_10110 [Lachnospiraceae bacterium]|nr:hypothetical protein [Lachnospiraceae bacterium]
MKEFQELDRQISQSMKSAGSLPRAPEDLKIRTIRRGVAIENGRNAERQLLEQADQLARGDPEKISQLATEALIGRMALHRPLPDGFEPVAESKKLAADPKFGKAIEGKAPGDLMKGIESGQLAKEVAFSVKEPKKQETKGLDRATNRIKENKLPSM